MGGSQRRDETLFVVGYTATHVLPALGQEDGAFKASLGYMASSRLARQFSESLPLNKI